MGEDITCLLVECLIFEEGTLEPRHAGEVGSLDDITEGDPDEFGVTLVELEAEFNQVSLEAGSEVKGADPIGSERFDMGEVLPKRGGISPDVSLEFVMAVSVSELDDEGR
jgi:hypothetical protein